MNSSKISVEYETEKQAKEAVSFVNNVRFFGAKVNVEQSAVEFSRRAEFNLRDESPNFADFSQNRNNRFLTDEAASKNRLSKAVKSLHFYNAPSSITIEELRRVSLLDFTVIYGFYIDESLIIVLLSVPETDSKSYKCWFSNKSAN